MTDDKQEKRMTEIKQFKAWGDALTDGLMAEVKDNSDLYAAARVKRMAVEHIRYGQSMADIEQFAEWLNANARRMIALAKHASGLDYIRPLMVEAAMPMHGGQQYRSHRMADINLIPEAELAQVARSLLLAKEAANVEAAKQLMQMAAGYLRNGQPMPQSLALYMAEAMETAVDNPARLDPKTADTGQALLYALHLKHNGPPVSGVDPFAVFCYVLDELTGPAEYDKPWPPARANRSPAKSPAEAIRRAAKHFKISVSTVGRYYRDVKKSQGGDRRRVLVEIWPHPEVTFWPG